MITMSVRISLLVVSLAALTGCDRMVKPLIVGRATVVTDRVILVGGQSNAFNMVYYASDALVAGIKADPTVGKVTILNCAVFSSSVDQWGPGSKNYNGCVAAAKGYHVDAIFWNQGENEAEGADDWSTWAMQTANIIQSMRRDIHAPNAPLVYARLSDFANTWPYWSQMRTEQANANIPNSVMVNLDGVTGTHPGQLHFDVDGYTEISRRFARAYREGL